MPIFYVNIDVRFKRRLDIVESDGRIRHQKVRGFMLEVGATFPTRHDLDQAIERLVTEDNDASNIRIIYDRIGVIDESDLEEEVYQDEDLGDSLLGDPLRDGIWYRTGRAYYTR